MCLKMSNFLQKTAKISSFWELRPQTPGSSGGWGLCPKTPGLQRLGASLPDPQLPPAAGGSASGPPNQSPPLQISGYGLLVEKFFFFVSLLFLTWQAAYKDKLFDLLRVLTFVSMELLFRCAAHWCCSLGSRPLRIKLCSHCTSGIENRLNRLLC